MPTFGFSVTDAYAVISAPACVSALKSVVFPAVGKTDDADLERHPCSPRRRQSPEAELGLAREADLRYSDPLERRPC